MVTDRYSGSTMVNIDKNQVKELSQIKPFRGLFQVFFEWGVIGSAIWLSEVYWNPLLYTLTVVVLGTRMHALAVLMHDATHYRLLKNKKWNNFIGEVILAWPLLMTLCAYRKNHFAHHHLTNTEQDPDWVRRAGDSEHAFPMSKKKLLAICLKYAVGFYAVDEIKKAAQIRTELPNVVRYGRMAFYLAFAFLATYFHFWTGFLLYWMVPFFTIFMLVLYIRGVAEHFACKDYSSILTGTRHTIASWFERLLIAPNNVNYHLDHHLYPGVPFYNLHKLHALLVADPTYSAKAHITDGYLTGLVKECISA